MIPGPGIRRFLDRARSGLAVQTWKGQGCSRILKLAHFEEPQVEFEVISALRDIEKERK
jgi:hypothetical protein